VRLFLADSTVLSTANDFRLLGYNNPRGLMTWRLKNQPNYGNCVPDILFGLDFVAAMRAVTDTPLNLHLMTHTTTSVFEPTKTFTDYDTLLCRRKEFQPLVFQGQRSRLLFDARWSI
jgi:hypothetical protein